LSSSAQPTSKFEILLEPNDSRRLSSLCGELNRHIRQIEERLGIRISNRANHFVFEGDSVKAESSAKLVENLYQMTESEKPLTPDQVHLELQSSAISELAAVPANKDSNEQISIRTQKELIRPQGANQKRYVQRIRSHDINFGVGPAGTGKTYLAVACAVEAYARDDVERILLVRPAVEAGEKLGFLPGDLTQKVDPYLRPLYDALYEMMGFETVARLIERNIIEVAPLAFMRGRTLNHSYVILDEAQNTTKEQMKMFLTRIGFGSTAIITGDVTQVDLPKNFPSGLIHAAQVLEGVEGISTTKFTSADVVRHPLVQRIVEAYDQFEQG
jgi:phosphate starvation-inducible protein PhoH and related proteins